MKDKIAQDMVVGDELIEIDAYLSRKEKLVTSCKEIIPYIEDFYKNFLNKSFLRI